MKLDLNSPAMKTSTVLVIFLCLFHSSNGFSTQSNTNIQVNSIQNLNVLSSPQKFSPSTGIVTKEVTKLYQNETLVTTPSSTIIKSISSSKHCVGSSILFILAMMFANPKSVFEAIKYPDIMTLTTISTVALSSKPWMTKDLVSFIQNTAYSILPFALHSFTKIVRMEAWGRFWNFTWSNFHKHIVQKLKIPSWLSKWQHMIDNNNILIKGYRRLFQRRVQKRIESDFLSLWEVIAKRLEDLYSTYVQPLQLSHSM